MSPIYLILVLTSQLVSSVKIRLTSTICNTEVKWLPLVRPVSLIACLKADKTATVYADGVLHSLQKQDMMLGATNFVDGHVVDVIKFIDDSEFISTQNIVRNRLDIFMKLDVNCASSNETKIKTITESGFAQTLDVNGSITIVNNPIDPIKSVESVCGDATSRIDIYFNGDFIMDRGSI